MKMVKKPNKWSCAITSLSMALNKPIGSLITLIGHDGSEIIFPHLDEPMCRKGFHPQELVKAAWNSGYSMTPVELFPTLLSSDGTQVKRVYDEDELVSWNRLVGLSIPNRGIIEGTGNHCKHAVCFQYGMIYDPDPDVDKYKFSKHDCECHGFYVNRLWVVKGNI